MKTHVSTINRHIKSLSLYTAVLGGLAIIWVGISMHLLIPTHQLEILRV